LIRHRVHNLNADLAFGFNQCAATVPSKAAMGGTSRTQKGMSFGFHVRLLSLTVARERNYPAMIAK